MDCSLIEEELCAYVDNELDPPERARVDGHLVLCEACTGEVAGLRAAKAVVNRLRRHDVDPPPTLRLLPDDVPGVAVPRRQVAWWRRPVHARYGLVAAAAAVVLALVAYPGYESRYHLRRLQRSVVAAYLQGTSSVIMGEPSSAARNISHRTTSIPPITRGDLYAVPKGVADCGGISAFHTIYLVGPHTVSQFRFEPGQFRDANLSPGIINGRPCRIGQVNGFSIASYLYGPAQVVLVTAGPPEALLYLAGNIPPDTPFAPSDAGR